MSAYRVGRQYAVRRRWVRRLDEHRRTQSAGAVVGQEWPVCDQMVSIRRDGEVDRGLNALAEGRAAKGRAARDELPGADLVLAMLDNAEAHLRADLALIDRVLEGS